MIAPRYFGAFGACMKHTASNFFETFRKIYFEIGNFLSYTAARKQWPGRILRLLGLEGWASVHPGFS